MQQTDSQIAYQRPLAGPTLGVRLPHPLRRAAEAAALARGETLSAFARRAIERAVEAAQRQRG